MAVDEQSEVFSFLRDLIRATNSGAVEWEVADPDGRAFYVASGGGGVRVQSVGEQDHPFLVTIFDRNERKVFEMQTEVAPFYNESENLAGELFLAARKSVFDVGGAIQNLRRSLGI